MGSKNKSETEAGLSHIPSYMDIPTGVFKDINHYRKVVSGVTKALARGRARAGRAATRRRSRR